MPKMNGIVLSQKLHNIDTTLLFGFITANKEDIDHLKKNNPDIEKIVIYKPIWLTNYEVKFIHFYHTNKKKTKINY
jgi:hypothetical protein